jgi:nicotinate-nucleotide adenylyltransferase
MAPGLRRARAKKSSSSRKHLRLGIYGGTFDPVHLGHLVAARDALEQARLDAVLFVPCARSPHKRGAPRTTDVQRLSLLRLALKEEPRFWLSRCELERPAPSSSIDTVREIQEAFPRAALFWLIGADQLPRLDQWHRWEDLRREVKFLLLERGKEAHDPATWGGAVLGLPHPRRMDISATEIRHRVKARLPIDHLVPAPVAAYIHRHGLYLS